MRAGAAQPRAGAAQGGPTAAVNPRRTCKGMELCSTMLGAAKGHRAQPGCEELPSAALLCWAGARALAQGAESSGGCSLGSPKSQA